MASGSTSFQGFLFRGGHIPHSNPTLGLMPFSSTGQSYNPFQSWTNPVVSGIGVGNQYFDQQGNVPYSLVNSFQSFSPFANAWNPYQGLAAPFNTLLGGNFTGYGGFSVGVAQTLNSVGPQGSPFGSVGSMSYFGQPGSFQNLGHSFHTFGNPARSGWNSQGPT